MGRRNRLFSVPAFSFETLYLVVNCVAPISFVFRQFVDPHRATQEQLGIHCGATDQPDLVAKLWTRMSGVSSAMVSFIAINALLIPPEDSRRSSERRFAIRLVALSGILRSACRWYSVRHLRGKMKDERRTEAISFLLTPTQLSVRTALSICFQMIAIWKWGFPVAC